MRQLALAAETVCHWQDQSGVYNTQKGEQQVMRLRRFAQNTVLAVLALFVIAAAHQTEATHAAPPPISQAPDSAPMIYPAAGSPAAFSESGSSLVQAQALTAPEGNWPMPFTIGYVQHRPSVHVIFWGSEWSEKLGVKESILNMYRWLSGSSYAKILTQYFDHQGPIGSETDLASFTDTRVVRPPFVTQADVRTEISYAIEHQPTWGRGIENQYVVLTPPGTPANEFSCAYHFWYAAPWEVTGTYAPFSSPNCQRNLEPKNSMQVTLSHEWAESATDPIPQENYWGWIRSLEGGEVADLCNDGTAAEHAEVAPNIYVAKLFDDYLWKATGNFCVAQDVSPVRYSINPVADQVTAPHYATLNASINPAGWPGKYQFAFTGPTGTTYIPPRNAQPQHGFGSFGNEGFADFGVSAAVSGLKGSTTYRMHLSGFSALTEPRLVEESGVPQIFDGPETQFTTPDWLPTIMSESTEHVTTHGVTLKATINPEGSPTHYHFEFGKTKAYGIRIPGSGEIDIGGGTAPVEISKEWAADSPEQTYHFRVVAQNDEGAEFGPDKEFTTHAEVVNFKSSFGELETRPTGFIAPMGMEADPAGNVWIADRLNNRIEKYDEQGKFKRIIGSKGTAPGLLSEPRDVALDAEGNIWVADMGNARIQEFSASGQFLRQIGGAGELNGFGEPYIGKPFGIALGREGHIFVTDQKWNNVQEYRSTPDGSGHYFVAQWGVVGGVGLQVPSGMSTDDESNVWFVTSSDSRVYEIPASGGAPIGRFGATGSGFGQTLEPSAIAIKPSGNVLIADRGNGRVVQFSPQGEQLEAFGAVGTGLGQFERPAGIALASNGLIFVADTGNSRIERWGQPAAPNADTQVATLVTGKGATLNGMVNPNSRATTYSFEYGPTTAYGSSVPVAAASVGNGFERVAVSQTLTLPAEVTYHYRVAASNEAGTTYGKDGQFKTAPVSQYQSAFGATGSGSGQFSHPADAAIDSKGNVWVVDKGNSRLEQFNEKGEFLKAVASIGAGGGKLTAPSGVVIDAKGNIWVSDTGNNRVEQFNEKGEFVSAFGKEVNKSRVEAGGSEAEKNRCTAVSGNVCQAGKAGSANGQFKEPKGIAATAGGNLMVVDAGNSRVQKVSPEGVYLAKIGSLGSGPAQLKEPSAVAVAPDASIWVADSGNNRLQQWTSTFELIGQVGSAGTGNGQFNRPDAVEVGGDGKVWVGDEGGDRIEAFNGKGEYLTQFGAVGAGPGQFKLTDPMGIAIDIKGAIWITDTDNNRVQKWIYE
jgi:sugar lactone lactonase YvrE